LNLGAEQVAFLQSQGIVPTVDSSKYSWDRSLDSTIEAVFTAEAGFLDGSDNTSNEGIETVGIVLSATSFYAEAGGQVPDSGVLTVSLANGQKATLEVLDVQIFGGYVLHTCSMVDVSSSDDDSFIPAHLIKRNAPVSVQVDYNRRRKVAPNHTMTHVLNYALRKALPENTIDQKGSLVNEEKLRFDFSLNRGLQLDELQAVEETVNKVILNELAVDSKVVPLKEASGIAGLRAVFGEVI
jgi:alanyl-tRNA synthetase